MNSRARARIRAIAAFLSISLISTGPALSASLSVYVNPAAGVDSTFVYQTSNDTPLSETRSVGDSILGASGYAAADFGVLKASASAQGSGGAYGIAYVNAMWEDSFTVVSDGLPYGTPVQLSGTLVLHAIASGGYVYNHPVYGLTSGDGYPTVPVPVTTLACGGFSRCFGFNLAEELYVTGSSVQSQYHRLDLNLMDWPGDNTRSVDFSISTFVGGTFNLQGSFTSNTWAGSDPTVMVQGSGGYASSHAGYDASYTGLLTLVSNTPGTGFTSQSGALYAPPVPVPGAVWLFGSALALAGVARRRGG